MITEKDVAAAFEELELDLIKSMRRNILHHLKEEAKEEINWSQWQSEMLKGVSEYVNENKNKIPKFSSKINKKIENMIKREYRDGALSQEKKILESILKGQEVKPSKNLKEKLKDVDGRTLKEKARNMLETDATFFKVNERALNSLIDEGLKGIKKTEASILRTSSDIYRDIIFKSQIKAQIGSKTIYQAVDEATAAFMSQGFLFTKYKDGKRVNIESYAEMAIRTSKKRAFLVGEGEMRKEWGQSLVLTSQYGSCSPTCLPYQNKVCIDDVWSGGKPDGEHPLLSDFMSGGFFHPNCRHTISTYFEDITTKTKDLDKKETSEHYALEQKQRYNERQIRKYKRLEAGALAQSNKDMYSILRQKYEDRNKKLIASHPNILRHDEWRENTLLIEETKTILMKPKSKIKDTTQKTIIEKLQDKNIFIKGEFGGLNKDVENHIFNTLDDLTNKYDVSEHLNKHRLSLRTKKDKSCAFYSHAIKTFSINEFVFSKTSFTNLNDLATTQKKMEDINFWMKCDDDKRDKYVITHEFGHFIEGYLHSKNQDMSYDLFNLKMRNKIRDIYKDIYNEDLEMSKYGKTSPSEFFAEAFVESELYSKSKFKKVFEILFKEYKLIK